MVHSLVRSLDLISNDEDSSSKARLVEPDPDLAHRDQLQRYHTPAYVGRL